MSTVTNQATTLKIKDPTAAAITAVVTTSVAAASADKNTKIDENPMIKSNYNFTTLSSNSLASKRTKQNAKLV